MEFSVRPIEGGPSFDATLEQALLAERLGFDGVYLAEHSGLDGPYWPNPLLGLAALVTRTSSVKLGTSILQLPLYNPVKLANSLALLDAISDGRTVCGIGVGWREAEFEAHGVPVSRRGALTTRNLRILRALLSGDSDDVDSEEFDIEGFSVSPEPVQRPCPPILVGGWSSAAIERAVELGDGWLSPGGPIEKNRAFVDEFTEHGGETVVLGTSGTVVREDSTSAVVATREFLKRRMMFHKRVGNERQYAAFNAHLSARGKPTATETATQLDRYAERYVDHLLHDGFDDYVSTQLFVAGTPDECVRQLERIVEQTGCREIVFRLHADGLPLEASTETLTLLGEDVLPSF